MKNVVVAIVLLLGIASAGDFGVQVETDIPLDPASVTAFVANPLGYAGSNLLGIRAFYEQGAWGYRFDLESSSHVQLGVYRRFAGASFILAAYEATIGVYGGYNWQGAGAFLRLRGRLLLYGSIGD